MPAATVALVVALTACDGGGDAEGIARSTIELRPTNYVTQPPATTTSTILGDPPAEPAGQEQTYTVQRGDALPLIASRYGVSVSDLVGHNGWDSPNQLILPGQEIRIPPNAQIPDDRADDRVEDPLDAVPEPNGAPLCPDGTQREVYEVRRNDYQGKVADRLDIELDELAAANDGNANWNSFIPGENLWLPCEDEDLDIASESTDS